MTNRQEMLENLDDYLQTAMQEWEIPGMAVAIVKDDEIVFAKGFGICELGKQNQVDQHTIFAIGSITKGFTVTALGLLVQEGKVAWDDAVNKYLPGFQMYDPYVTREITVRDLLCHRSGLPTFGGDLLSYGSRLSRDELIHQVRYIPPAFSFRSSFGYSNLMFVTAGQIISAITGLRWDDFVKQRILVPLGMTRSNTSTNELAGLSNIASPHEMIKDQVRPVLYRNIDNIGPAGAINSTVWDMSQWIRLQLNNGTYGETRLVDEAIIEEMRAPHNPLPIPPSGRALNPYRHLMAYGLGWELMDYRGCLIVRHGGGIDGMISLLGLVPEEKLGVIILTNKIPNDITYAVLYHVVDAYLEAPPKDWNKMLLEQNNKFFAEIAEQKKKIEQARVKGTKPTLSLEQYAGTYNSQLYGDATVAMQDNQLVIHLSAHPMITGILEHWHYDAFLCHWTDPIFDQSLVPFILNGQGKVEEFRLKVREDTIDTLEYKFRRVPEKQV
jgi:CubicO group peptidase (beta-lactamase class C family)